MKKIYLIVGMAMLLMSLFVSAKLDEERCNKEQIPLEICEYEINGGGGGFIIHKDKTILGLTSEYDGKGFGLVMGGVNSQGRTIYINNGLYNLRKVNFKTDEYTRTIPFHFKSITPKDDKSIEQFEILFEEKYNPTLDLTFRVKKEYINPTFRSETEELLATPSKDDINFNYFIVRVERSGVVTIMEGSPKMEQSKEVTIEVPIEIPKQEAPIPAPIPTPELVPEKVGFWGKIKGWFS